MRRRRRFHVGDIVRCRSVGWWVGRVVRIRGLTPAEQKLYRGVSGRRKTPRLVVRRRNGSECDAPAFDFELVQLEMFR